MSSSVTAAPTDSDEQIINWQDEANAIINDVKSHVAEIVISSLPCNSGSIYLNMRTIEGAACCVHVSGLGFRVVSNAYDTIDADKAQPQAEEEVYETPYALLDKLSPRYVESFGNQLCQQLRQLQQTRTAFNEEDEDCIEEEEEDDDAGLDKLQQSNCNKAKSDGERG